jgi:hypothetical protein
MEDYTTLSVLGGGSKDDINDINDHERGRGRDNIRDYGIMKEGPKHRSQNELS